MVSIKKDHIGLYLCEPNKQNILPDIVCNANNGNIEPIKKEDKK
jgi:hypothetical protein